MKLTLISGLFIILLCRNINFTNAAEHTIFLIDSGFNPKSVTANIGDTVTFWDASIVDKFNRTTVRQIVQAEGDASGCMQSTNPGAFSISISSTSPKSTVTIGSAGTISFFNNGQCQNGFWGSIEVIDPNSPSSGNSTSIAENPSPSGDSSSDSHSAGNSSPISPYIDPVMKAHKLKTWELVLIAISSVTAMALMLTVTYFVLRNKSEQSKVTTNFVNVTPNNTPNTNVDSNNVESNNVESNNVDSNNVESNNVDSNNVESNNVDSNNVESNNVDSNNVESNNVDSNNVDSNNVDSNNVDSNNIDVDSNNVDSNNVDTNNVDSNNTSNIDSNNSNSNINVNNDNNV